MKHLLLHICLCYSFGVLAQVTSDKSYFLVTPDHFEPPTRALIESFEGQSAEPFMANDIKGSEHYLPAYEGQAVVVWFWDTDSPLARSQVDALNRLDDDDQIQIISFARKSSTALRPIVKSLGVKFPVIGNADVFGQMAYGAELGYPRFFLIDKQGVIRVVLPPAAFAGEGDIYHALKGIIGGF